MVEVHKKAVLVLLAALFFTGHVSAQAYNEYSLNDTSPFMDLQENDFLSSSGGVTTGASGVQKSNGSWNNGGAIITDGNDDYLYNDTSGYSVSGDFSFSIWYETTYSYSDGDRGHIIRIGDGDSSDNAHVAFRDSLSTSQSLLVDRSAF